MRRTLTRLTVGAAFVVLISAVFGQTKPAGDVAIEGDVNKPQHWTTAQIMSEFAKDAKTIKYTGKADSHSALAVPLLSLVNAGDPKLDPKVKNQQLRLAVVVEGSDGYMATFSMAELIPDFGNREVWVALDEDDKPLSDRDAPAAVIVPTDQKQGRWVHGVKTVRVVDMGASHAGS